MRYTVTWTPTAVNELARFWNESAERRAIADAADEIDRLLRFSPESAGVDWGGERYLEIPPLAAIFTVRPEDRMVEVIGVWLFA